MIFEFKYSFSHLEVSKTEVAEFMGFEPNAIPEPFLEIIEKGLQISAEIIKPIGGYVVFDHPEIDSKTVILKVAGKTFHPAKVVISQIKNASSLAFFICTAGKEISEKSKEFSENNDPLTGYILDVIGSIAADKTAELVQKELEISCSKNRLKISDRFSPGYCEWSVSEQKLLFELFPQKIFGVELTESSLMYPVKSVSGIIGIGKSLSQKGYQCQWCDDKDCFVGKLKRKKKDEKKLKKTVV
jgi:hypothetical protein